MSKKKYILLDTLIIVVMSILLYYGVSRQLFLWYTDAGKYECYAVAFWHGTSALKHLAVPPLQCHFLTQPRPSTIFITTDTLVTTMKMLGLPVGLVSFVASQSPILPLHTLPYEYPLLVIMPFTFGLIVPAYWYQVIFAVGMVVLAAALYFVFVAFQSRKAAIAFAIYLVTAGWGTEAARFDIIPAGLTLIALLCAERARWKWAFALLAIATMFKFYPLVLLPIFFIAQQKSLRDVWYALRRWSGLYTFIVVCAVVVAFSLVLSVQGTLAPLGYFGNRPIQIESSSASLLWLTSLLGYPLHYEVSFGSLNETSRFSTIVSLISTLLLITGVVYIFWLQWRGKVTLAAAILLMLLVVIFAGKVFSPQYLLWVVPFIAYVGEINWKWLSSWILIGLLTTWIYPYMYAVGILNAPHLPLFHPAIFVRNTLMLCFILVLLYQYSQTRFPSKAAMKPLEREMVAHTLEQTRENTNG